MKYIPPLNALPGDEEDENRSHWNADPSGNNVPLREGAYPSALGFEAVQREIVAVIEGAGLTPDGEDLEQLFAAIQVLVPSFNIPDLTVLTDVNDADFIVLSDTSAAGAHKKVPLSVLKTYMQFYDVGRVSFFSRNSAPAGYLKCNGAAISRTTYANLFSVIGTTFGVGDGATTFNIPDIRGEFIRGWDDGRGIDSGRAFGSAQTEETNNLRGVRNGPPVAIGTEDPIPQDGTWSSGIQGYWTPSDSSRQFRMSGEETRPRNLAFLACIKY